MNYILPDNFSFYDELQKNVIDVTDITDVCLINGEPLDTDSYIKLDCGHLFNYIPLLKDTMSQKCNLLLNKYTKYSSIKLKEHQLACPYCRQIQDTILPYFPELFPKKIRGINHPHSLSMGKNRCPHIFKSGKNKDTSCDKVCYRNKCHIHIKPIKQNKVEIDISTIVRDNETLNKCTLVTLRKMAKFYKLKKYSTLKKKDLIFLLVTAQSVIHLSTII